MNNHLDLQKAIDIVKNTESMKGITVTDDQIATKLAIPANKFNAYLKGSEPSPEDLPTTLLEAYGHKLKKVEFSVVKNVHRPLSPAQREELLSTVKVRFEKNRNRHKGLEWADVQARLEGNNVRLWSLHEMERTGGEPDVVAHDKKTGEYIFYDCSAESPKGRRSICYDREAHEARKEHKPENNVVDMASAMGIELLTEEQYLDLQKLGNFDTKTSSWVKTPFDIRKLGGAIFADLRYGRVFVYHNGAESYYAARGFRGS